MSARPPTGPSALKQIWLKWKTLRLPWRRQFLAGADLSGNTFWEFKDAMNAQRFRRIVKYSKQSHYADVKISRKSLDRVADKRLHRTLRFGSKSDLLTSTLNSPMASMAPTHSPRAPLDPRTDLRHRAPRAHERARRAG
jgi:hypothetical protein